MNIEILEARIAPAAVVAANHFSATYTDVDGDLVTIVFSQPIAHLATLSTVAGGLGETLTQIDVSTSAQDGLNVQIVATPRDVNHDGLPDGDGLANVGYLKATGRNLGMVSVDGDLGKIDAGRGSGTATAALTVYSLYGVGAESGAPDFTSNLSGSLGSLVVVGDVHGRLAATKIGSITIGGSLVGGADDYSGRITTTQGMGPIKIGHNLEGGAGMYSGSIEASAGGPVPSITIGGSVFGGKGAHSGEVKTPALGTLTIARDLQGGFGTQSGAVLTTVGGVGSLTLGGSLLGGYGDKSAVINSAGAIGTLVIKSNLVGNSSETALVRATTTITNLTIGGSLIGAAIGSASIRAHDLMQVTVGHSLQGLADFTSEIVAGGLLGNVTVGGSVYGGYGSNSGTLGGATVGTVKIIGNLSASPLKYISAGQNSAQIFSTGNMGTVTILGSILGGTDSTPADRVSVGTLSGSVISGGTLASVTVGGSVVGGSAKQSGTIRSHGDVGSISILGDVRGGLGAESGSVFLNSNGKSVRIGGSMIGGSDPDPDDAVFLGSYSGYVFVANSLDSLTVVGSLEGGSGIFSGRAYTTGLFKSVTVGGSVRGGDGFDSGTVQAQGSIANLRIAHDVQGGLGIGSGGLMAPLLTTGSIGGSIVGGQGTRTGVLDLAVAGSLSIGGDLIGSIYENSGVLRGTKIASLTIAGSVVGGTANFSGSIQYTGEIGLLNLRHDLHGGDENYGDFSDSGNIVAGRIATLNIGGSIIAGHLYSSGTLANSGSITVQQDLGSLLVGGSVVGNSGLPVVISASGQATPTETTDVAIGKITVVGRVEFAKILGGYDLTGMGNNADAQIGAVTVGGDWLASSLVAGVGSAGPFGLATDHKLAGVSVKDGAAISKIASVVILGQVRGATGTANTFGFAAEQVGAFKVNGFALTLQAGAHTDTFALGKARAVGSSLSASNSDGFAVHVFEVPAPSVL